MVQVIRDTPRHSGVESDKEPFGDHRVVETLEEKLKNLAFPICHQMFPEEGSAWCLNSLHKPPAVI